MYYNIRSIRSASSIKLGGGAANMGMMIMRMTMVMMRCLIRFGNPAGRRGIVHGVVGTIIWSGREFGEGYFSRQINPFLQTFWWRDPNIHIEWSYTSFGETLKKGTHRWYMIQFESPFRHPVGVFIDFPSGYTRWETMHAPDAPSLTRKLNNF